MDKVEMLKKQANRIRVECLKSVYTAGSGHLGGSFSSAEIMSILLHSSLNS